MKKRLRIFCLLAIGCGMLFGLGCDKIAGPKPPPAGPLQLLLPAGGETYKVGDSMKMKWQINDTSVIAMASVVVWYSLDGGLTWPKTQLINNPQPPFGSFPLDVSSFSWKIDSSCVSNKFKISVTDYDYGYRSGSGLITITK